MAIGTLSACLPTYRPILHRLLKGRTFDSTRRTPTSRNTKSSRSRRVETDASSVHPFNRLEDSPHMGGDWTLSMPLAALTHTTKTGDRASESMMDTESGPHRIKTVMDLHQRSS